MEKKKCAEGQIWDSLLLCFSRKTETKLKPQTTEQPMMTVHQLRAAAATIAKPDSVMVLSPALWICMGLATLGSILALALWFVLYRKTRLSGTFEDTVPELEVLQKTEPPAKVHPPSSERDGQAEMFQRAAESSSACLHLHGSKWEDGFTVCTGSAKHAEKEERGELSACNTVAEHRIPLPATELGGTALVTTKTV